MFPSRLASPLEPWTGADDAVAAESGWGLFNVDSAPSIQRDDEMQLFESDDDAIEWIADQARALAETVPDSLFSRALLLHFGVVQWQPPLAGDLATPGGISDPIFMPVRSILHPDAPQRVILAACPYCAKDHTSWSGCILAELCSVLQDRGWSTQEIADAVGKIPDFQEIYDAHIGPAVDALEEYLPTQEELEAQEQAEAEANGPSEAQLERLYDAIPFSEGQMSYLDKDALGRGGLR